MRRLVPLWALVGACSGSETIIVDPPWPSDRIVVLVEYGEGDGPIAARAYPPGAPIVFSVTTGHRGGLTAITYPPTEHAEIDPALCGVNLDRTNPIALVPEAAYRSPITEWSDSAGPMFSQTDPEALDLPLGYSNCVTDRFDCSQLHLETFQTIHADGKLRDVAAVSDELVFYSATARTDPLVDDFHLYRGSFPSGGPQDQRALIAPPELQRQTKALTFDGTSILGRTEDGAAFSATTEGVITYTSSIAGYKGIAARAGLTIEFGRDGLRSLDGSIPPFLAPTYSVAIVDPTRIAAATDAGIQYWDGARWAVEYPLNSGKGWKVGGDADVFIAIQTDGTVIERNPVNRTWDPQGQPVGAYTDLKGAIGLGGGRWMIAGQDGVLAIKLTGGRICMAPRVGPNNFENVSLSPSGKTVWLGMSPNSSIAGDPALLVRIRLPTPL